MWMNSRYGSPRMKHLWSTEFQVQIWCQLWREALANQQQYTFNPDPREDIPFSLYYDPDTIDESQTGHEIDSVREYLEKKYRISTLHLGMTSSDISDNADAIRIELSMQVLLSKLSLLIERLGITAIKTAKIAIMGMTHLQPAEPTSLGYRWLNHVEELYRVFTAMSSVTQNFPLLKTQFGAVGTNIVLDLLTDGAGMEIAHEAVRATWNKFLDTNPVVPNNTVSQTSSRANENQVLQQLSALSVAAARLAINVRHMQMQGHIREPHRGAQRHVGSSAMPHKHNPIIAESVSGLTKLVIQLINAHTLMCCDQILERTLDDSSLRRQALPQIFLYTDEILDKLLSLVEGWSFDLRAIERSVHENDIQSLSSRIVSAMVLAYPEKTRSEIYQEIQTWALTRRTPDARYIMTKEYPKLTELLIKKGIEDQFWDVQYLGKIPEYVTTRMVQITKELRKFSRNGQKVGFIDAN